MSQIAGRYHLHATGESADMGEKSKIAGTCEQAPFYCPADFLNTLVWSADAGVTFTHHCDALDFPDAKSRRVIHKAIRRAARATNAEEVDPAIEYAIRRVSREFLLSGTSPDTNWGYWSTIEVLSSQYVNHPSRVTNGRRWSFWR